MSELQISQTRAMLKSYEQQLLTARKLAKHRVKTRLAEGLNAEDPDPSRKRGEFVKLVARELFDSMIFTGSENPVVEEIRRELGRVLGKEVEFAYPPGGKLCIVARGAEGLRPLDAGEQALARDALREITSQTVDKSMLEKPKRVGMCC